MDAEINDFYERGDEDRRLTVGGGSRLEFVRTRELLERYLPDSPARVLDVGGGTGIYAFELCARGYDVAMIDPVQIHVDRARELIEERQLAESMTADVGDARRLEFNDDAFDAVLMLGPLYHLTEPTDRALAWSEAVRVTRPGATVMAVGISRFASLLDGLKRNVLSDPVFRSVVEADLADGQHRNPGGSRRQELFTTAYFHSAAGLVEEATDAGLDDIKILGVEGPAWMVENLDEIDAQVDAARATEAEPSLMGATSHLMLIGTTSREPQSPSSTDDASGEDPLI